MSMAIPQTEDTQLNMTPMIDVVFQLVTFFLLTLHFSTAEERIDASMPLTAGMLPIHSPSDERVPLKVKVFRVDSVDPERAFTRVRIGNAWTLDVPRDPREAEGAWRKVTEAIRSQYRTLAAAGSVRGEIVAPDPHGGAVPHGDVMRVLDGFLLCDLKDVAFEGTHRPESWR